MRTKIAAQWWSTLDLAALMRDSKIYLDDAFQSYHRWVTENNQKYMKSLLNGKAPTPIYVADIAACLQSVISRYGIKHSDVEFYQKLLDQGYKYITIDGNNRSRCITDFFFGIFKGFFPLIEGDYEIGTTEVEGIAPITFTATSHSKEFNDIDPRIQVDLRNIKRLVMIVESGTREDLAELFDSINTGMVLNAQEKRNCKMYTFSHLVRECVKKHKTKFSKIYNEKGFNRRIVDEFVVDVAVLCARGIVGFGPKTRDAAYGDGTVEVQSFNRADKIIGQIGELMKYRIDGDRLFDCTKRTATNVVDLALLLNYMNKNNIVYTDKKKFFDEFSNAQAARLGDPTILWRKIDKDKNSPNYGKPTGTDDRGYAGVQRSSAQVNFVTIRENQLISSLSDFSDGLIICRDSQRNFKRDVTLLYRLWKKQGGVCPESGNLINCRDILNGSIIEVDHHYPWSKGGKTEEDNGALLYATANNAKGASLPVDIEEVSFDESLAA